MTAVDAFIESLLSSPQYGAHWGRRWLDLARYADTAGENTDRPLTHGWRYRNWVFDAFNRDLRYDDFVRAQIAGDLIFTGAPAPARAEGIVATGYLAVARRFGHDIEKDMHLTHEDVIDTLGKNFLGLTLGCARCHDHKYDPVTARDYYALYGIFSSTRFAFPGCEPKGQPRDMVPLIAQAESDALMKPWQERVAHLAEEPGRKGRPARRHGASQAGRRRRGRRKVGRVRDQGEGPERRDASADRVAQRQPRSGHHPGRLAHQGMRRSRARLERGGTGARPAAG